MLPPTDLIARLDRLESLLLQLINRDTPSDAAYLATLPVEEAKRILREKRKGARPCGQ